MFFLVTPYAGLIGLTFNRFGFPFVTALITGLCFTSAACVRHSPRLARIGIVTLVGPFLILSCVVLIGFIFQAAIEHK
jgi:hypothetical protein